MSNSRKRSVRIRELLHIVESSKSIGPAETLDKMNEIFEVESVPDMLRVLEWALEKIEYLEESDDSFNQIQYHLMKLSKLRYS